MGVIIMSNRDGIIVKIIINAIAIYATAKLVKGVEISSFGTAIVAALVLSIVNALIKPLLMVLTLPVNFLSLGLFTFVVDGLSLMIVSGITKGFEIHGIGPAMLASIIISVISALLGLFID